MTQAAEEAELPVVDVEPPVTEAPPDQPGESAEVALNSVRSFPVPYPRDNYVCPACEQEIPTRKQRRLNNPAKYEHELNQIFQCPFCMFYFSPRRFEGALISR